MHGRIAQSRVEEYYERAHSGVVADALDGDELLGSGGDEEGDLAFFGKRERTGVAVPLEFGGHLGGEPSRLFAGSDSLAPLLLAHSSAHSSLGDGSTSAPLASSSLSIDPQHTTRGAGIVLPTLPRILGQPLVVEAHRYILPSDRLKHVDEQSSEFTIGSIQLIPRGSSLDRSVGIVVAEGAAQSSPLLFTAAALGVLLDSEFRPDRKFDVHAR
mmetsp:Transcript_25131/g.73680  ORF Transcript_25131/g.73680 Transcript_25131/m.73680 type:complete len:214 (+) Transcript_25131:821-1462(+)